MKNLYNDNIVSEIFQRLDRLSPDAERLWGKMSPAQMLAHCSAALEVATAQKFPPRLWIGKILGPIAKSGYVSNKPFGRNSPTDKSFIITDIRDYNQEKKRLKELITKFHNDGEGGCTTHPHPFFGRLTPKEWSISMFKHLDHHLRQFGV